MNDLGQNWLNFIVVVGTLLIFSLGVVIILLIVKFQRKLYKNEIRLQKDLTRVSIESQEKERERIAQELHDEVSSILAAAKMQIAFLPEIINNPLLVQNSITESKKLLERSINQIRNLSHELSPTFLATFGLENSLKQFFESIKDLIEIQFSYTIDHKLSYEQELALYRIVLELSQNTLKHAEAKLISINLSEKSKRAILEYTDNGKGIDQTHVAQKKGLGLRNIESRVNASQGDMKFLDISQGFCVQIALPI
ncbi:MAG: histidine kinase [Raineya sp.]|jgi:signal transduction histidine kinase|nr:histidine kinase [Raineya sp.]